MTEDVISNDCDISETFINPANIAPSNIDRQIDRQIDDIDRYIQQIYIYVYIYIYIYIFIYMQLYQSGLYYTIPIYFLNINAVLRVTTRKIV